MKGSDPKQKNPLSPYYPAEIPPIPGSGRKWFAIFLSLIVLLGAVGGVFWLIRGLF